MSTKPIPMYMTLLGTDGSIWGVPIEVIAKHRATHYSDEFGDDVQRSLDEDTLPLFRESRFEIVDWAKNNMDWSDFGDTPVKLKDAKPTDWNEHYMNAASSFDDEDDPEVAS